MNGQALQETPLRVTGLALAAALAALVALLAARRQGARRAQATFLDIGLWKPAGQGNKTNKSEAENH